MMSEENSETIKKINQKEQESCETADRKRNLNGAGVNR